MLNWTSMPLNCHGMPGIVNGIVSLDGNHAAVQIEQVIPGWIDVGREVVLDMLSLGEYMQEAKQYGEDEAFHKGKVGNFWYG